MGTDSPKDDVTSPSATPDEDVPANALWQGDSGTLRERTRRALLALLTGPYLSARTKPHLWSALVADEVLIRSRLNDVFLDLVIDHSEEFAYVVKPESLERDIPSALRTERLSFIDTAMLLLMRQMMLSSPNERLIIGKGDLFDPLSIYQGSQDAVSFRKKLNAAWTRMRQKYGLLHDAGEDRAEISPLVKYVIDENRVRTLLASYRAAAEASDATGPVSGDGFTGVTLTENSLFDERGESGEPSV